MKYVSLIVSEDAAHECVHQLGELGSMQLTDLNGELTPFQRRYVNYIKRCEELERKLRYMEKEIVGFGLTIEPAAETVEGTGSKRTGAAILDALEVDLEKYEEQLLELNNYSTELTSRYNEKIEYQECLEKGKAFFGDIAAAQMLQGTPYQRNPLLDSQTPLLDEPTAHRAVEVDMKFSSKIGVVKADEKTRFERMLFRSTRGNCLVRFAEVERPIADAATGAAGVKMMVFIIFFKSDVIGAIVNRICQAFGARQYPVPDHTQPGDAAKLDSLLRDTFSELTDAREVLLKNRELRLALCSRLAQRFGEWQSIVLKEKAVYHALNLFKADVAGMLRGEGWIIASAENEARALVQRAHAAMDLAGASMLAQVQEPWPTPPTHFETNAFTYAYQEFVNTYGVPRYKEINPALFTAVTFPFLFGMMYGDVGHGTCIFLAGLYLVFSYQSFAAKGSKDEMLEGLYSARFMLTMMGFAAVYCGLIYNDMFALTLRIFDSGYDFGKEIENANSPSKAAEDLSEDERTAEYKGKYGDPDYVYPFGVDPAWHVSENELLFFNSMKMKTAVIVGIAQMTGGIILKGINALYFKDYVVFLLEFIPMIIFDMALFGYMVILIMMKWGIDWDDRQARASCFVAAEGGGWTLCTSDIDQSTCVDYSKTRSCDTTMSGKELCGKNGYEFGGESNGCEPPNLINQLINIALTPGTVETPIYNNQGGIQTALLLIAFLSVPVLLLGKPLYVYFTHHDNSHAQRSGSTAIEMHQTDLENLNHRPLDHVESQPEPASHGSADEEEHSFTEVLIHQCIETIEFVLGMVSNTASYLRLWALSLAHSELAEVFWSKTMQTAINTNSAPAIFVAYAIFAVVTAAVLLAMDLLECFLHALRLHWVEFQNKFYKADGYKFAPFDLSKVISA